MASFIAQFLNAVSACLVVVGLLMAAVFISKLMD